ncbi:MAG: M48 family metallopeptidase, partial [Candidatus Eremiobacterota bacterium]
SHGSAHGQATLPEVTMQQEVRVIRSGRRRRTVSATLDRGVLVVRIPARMSRREEAEWVERMRERMGARLRQPGDRQLHERAQQLNRLYFAGELTFSIDWTDQSKSRWGSCTPLTGGIRIARELAGFPRFVLDYVIVHELAHLIESDHSEAFWALVRRYPHTERAIGFLMGVSAARSQPFS